MINLDALKKKVNLPGVPPKPTKKLPEANSSGPQSLGRDYVIPYVQEEIERYKRASRRNPNEEQHDSQDNRSHCDLSEVDSMTIGTMATSMEDDDTRIYHKYNFEINKESKRLKVYESKDEILSAIEAKRIVIIKGATGCGKTTQVPQFIIADAKEKKKHCSIVITQPRRIAAVSIATRVAVELKCALGTLVGYQIGLDKKADEDTRILYVTTGVLLHKLINQKDMKEFTHYIIDEIHERDQDMDFLLLVARNFLNTKSKDTKLILMSATIDTSKFHDYLITYYGEKQYKPQIVNISDRTPYKVMTFFLNDFSTGKNRIVEAASLKTFSINNPEIQPNAYKAAARIIIELDKTESQRKDGESSDNKKGGAVLVFLPGLHEIQTMEKTLNEMCTQEQKDSLWILPLHSSITADEQQAVFKDPPASKRKVILSTNIAESSVTVTDIGYAIDFCLTKALLTDLETGCTTLELTWASKNSLIQRAGRVGRVREGRVYRMITSEFYDRYLEQDAKPEILRCPLETLVLKAKLLGMGPPKKILALAMDQPDLANIHQAVARLKEIGALLICASDEYDPADGDLTLLGEIIANLPLDVRLGKLIFLGIVFGVPEECIIMACAMSGRNIFSTPYSKELEAYNQKLVWAHSSGSDCVAFLNAYKVFRRFREEYKTSVKELTKFTGDNFLQVRALREVYELESDIKRRLKDNELYSFERQRSFPKNARTAVDPEDEYRPFFIKLAIAGAFYPNYFVRGASHTQDTEKVVVQTLNGHDPFSTVYLQGLPPSGEHNAIFKRCIKKQFEGICERLDVNLDNSSKVYITFRPPKTTDEEGGEEQGMVDGKICMPVYRAIKMGQIGTRFAIPRMKPGEIASAYSEYVEEKMKRDCGASDKFQNRIRKLMWPWRKEELNHVILQNEILEVMVSHVESPQRFWVQSSLKNSVQMRIDMVKKLNDRKDDVLIKLPGNARLPIDSTRTYVASHDNVFYRCRIVARNLGGNKYTIYFPDYGYSRFNVPVSEIYDLHPKVKEELFYDQLPDFAIECSLVKMQPKTHKLIGKPLEGNVWSGRASNILKSYINQPTIAKVYSFVSNVLRLKLVQPKLKSRGYNFECTVNHILLKEGLAEKVDEDYLSLYMHHELKRRILTRDNIQKEQKNPALDESFLQPCKIPEDCEDKEEVEGEESQRTNIINSLSFDDFELPVNPDYSSQTTLRGPSSPLEMKVFSLTKDMQGRHANVDRDSVNSVLLDSDPSNPKEKMLVAAYVGINPSKGRLNLKHTTIMPPLPALPMLCCLTFAPMVQMRVNPTKTKYCGALCGLGYNKITGNSFYPADDISVTFDYEITDLELELINKIRYNMSVTINPPIRNSKDHLLQCKQKLREYLKTLFLENPYKLQETLFTADPWNWGSMKNEKLMNPVTEGGARHPAEDFSFAYRLIWAVPRKGDLEREMKDIKSKLTMLEEFSNGQSTRSSIDCPLCGISVQNASSAKLHLKVATHRARFSRYKQMISK